MSSGDITPYSPLKVRRRFAGTFRLHLESRRISQAREQRKAGDKESCACDLLSAVLCKFFVLSKISKFIKFEDTKIRKF
jgi:hypothetical protein